MQVCAIWIVPAHVAGDEIYDVCGEIYGDTLSSIQVAITLIVFRGSLSVVAIENSPGSTGSVRSSKKYARGKDAENLISLGQGREFRVIQQRSVLL